MIKFVYIPYDFGIQSLMKLDLFLVCLLEHWHVLCV